MALDPDIAYWCEMAEAHAWGDMFAATAEQPGNPMGAHVETPGDGVVFALTALDTFLCNRALGIGVARRAIQSDVDAAVGFFDRLGRTDTAAPLSPHATPPDLRVWFEERGYVPSRNWVKLWHDLRALPTASTDLRIELVGPEWAGDFARISVVEKTYGFPARDRARGVGDHGAAGLAALPRVRWRRARFVRGDADRRRDRMVGLRCNDRGLPRSRRPIGDVRSTPQGRARCRVPARDHGDRRRDRGEPEPELPKHDPGRVPAGIRTS